MNVDNKLIPPKNIAAGGHINEEAAVPKISKIPAPPN